MSCCYKTSQKGGGKGGKKKGKSYLMLSLLPLLSLNRCIMTQVLGIKFYFLAMCSVVTQTGGGTARRSDVHTYSA